MGKFSICFKRREVKDDEIKDFPDYRSFELSVLLNEPHVIRYIGWSDGFNAIGKSITYENRKEILEEIKNFALSFEQVHA